MADSIIGTTSTFIPNGKILLLFLVFAGLFLKSGGKLKDLLGKLRASGLEKGMGANEAEAQEKFFLALASPLIAN